MNPDVFINFNIHWEKGLLIIPGRRMGLRASNSQQNAFIDDRLLPGHFFLNCPNLAIPILLLMASVTELLSGAHDIHNLMLAKMWNRVLTKINI